MKEKSIDSMRGVTAFIENWTEEDIAYYVSKGAHIFYHRQVGGETIHIPTAYFVCERVVAGPFVYGVRKSFFYKHKDAYEGYTMAKAFLQKDGVDVAKMSEIAKCMLT